MSELITVKMAKPSQEDNESILKFFQELEEVLDGPHHDLDEDGIATIILRHWPAVSRSWSRVYWAGRTAIENACDPSLGYLEYKPGIRNLKQQRDELAESVLCFLDEPPEDEDEYSQVAGLIAGQCMEILID